MRLHRRSFVRLQRWGREFLAVVLARCFWFKASVVNTLGGRALGGCRYPGTAVLDFGRQVGWITKQYNGNKYLLAISIIFKNSNHVQVFICIDVFHESRVVF